MSASLMGLLARFRLRIDGECACETYSETRIFSHLECSHHAQKYYDDLRNAACDILVGKKDRRRGTINRNFMGDYIGFQDNPTLRALVGKKERVVFAYTANKSVCDRESLRMRTT